MTSENYLGAFLPKSVALYVAPALRVGPAALCALMSLPGTAVSRVGTSVAVWGGVLFIWQLRLLRSGFSRRQRLWERCTPLRPQLRGTAPTVLPNRPTGAQQLLAVWMLRSTRPQELGKQQPLP